MGPGLLRVQSELHLCTVREFVLLNVVLTKLTIWLSLASAIKCLTWRSNLVFFWKDVVICLTSPSALTVIVFS